jgi:putative nucleotidyltransferase with HDIG domain
MAEKYDNDFNSRYFEEFKLRERLKLALILSIILYPSFLILDAIVTPDRLKAFFIIRLAVIFLNALLFLLLHYTKSYKGVLNLCMTLLVLDGAGISLMVFLMGGFASFYYQGLTLVIMVMMVILPFSLREGIITMSLIWASYFVPSLFIIKGQAAVLQSIAEFFGLPEPIAGWRISINNLFFLTAIVTISVIATSIMDNYRRRELKSRIDLEKATTQLQETNEKLKTLDELKTQFFANVNHELRTPLTLMLAPLKSLLEDSKKKLSASVQDTLATMQRNGYKLLKLINNLLDLNKLEEGKMRLKIRTVNFTDYVSGLLASVKPMADQKKIKLYFQHPPHALDLIIDPDQFEKVVLNLLSNALKFTPAQGKITLYIEDKDHTVALTVEDTGIGIPAHMLDSIFNRFSQVDGSKSRPHEGTGIGLSLAREIVSLHGGSIRAESTLGRGSSFIVDLKKGEAHFDEEILDRRSEDQPVGLKRRMSDIEEPRVQDIVTDFRRLQLVDLERVEIETPGESRIQTHDNLILVIDDNPEVLKLMKMLLSDEFDLELTTSAETGLELLRKKNPDLVLCDVMMPGMDGHTFARKVKSDENWKHIPIILVTARTGAEMMNEGIQAGADDYISKPFDSIELKARIKSQLRMRAVESELALANRNLKMRASDLVEQQRSLFLSTVKSLASAIDAKDEYTRHHSTRVTEFSLKIAKKMGFSEKELEDLELAALLHDVGKIAVPEDILNKPGRLTDEEFAQIKEHPARGESILKPVVELREIARVVRAHHEQYDGKGYPDGLKGREIPLGARIMSLADTYDSITSDRPYRKAASHRHAVKEIIRCSSTQFDPEVVDHFLEICNTFTAEEEKEPASEETKS